MTRGLRSADARRNFRAARVWGAARLGPGQGPGDEVAAEPPQRLPARLAHVSRNPSPRRVGSGSFSTPKSALKGSSSLSRSALAKETPPVVKQWRNWVPSPPRACGPLPWCVRGSGAGWRWMRLAGPNSSRQGRHGQLAAMHTGLVGVAEFDEKLAGVEREEFGPARWTAPTEILLTLRVSRLAWSGRIRLRSPGADNVLCCDPLYG